MPSLNLVSNPPESKTKLHRRKPRLYVAVLLIVALLAALGGTMYRLSRPPHYEFDLSNVHEPVDVHRFLYIASRLRQIRNWHPTWYSEESRAVLAELIQQNPEVGELRELLRAPPISHPDPEFGRKIVSSNAAIHLLSRRIPAERFKELPTNRDELSATLQEELDGLIRAEREKSVRELLNDVDIEQLFAGYKLPVRPNELGAMRKAARWCFRTQFDDRRVWENGFLAAIDAEIAPMDAHYRRLEHAHRVPFGNGSASLWLVRPEGAAIQYAGRDSTISYRLMQSRSETSEMLDTGVRLFKTPLIESKREDVDATRRASLRHGWPPASVGIVESKFVAFLRRHGLPGRFGIRDISHVVEGTALQPRIHATCRIYHRDVPSCAWNLQLPFGAQSTERLDKALQSVGSASVIARFRKQLLTVSLHNNVPVRLALDRSDPNAFVAEVRVAGISPLHLRVAIAGDGRLVWSESPLVSERSSIAKRLCGEIADLRGLAGLITIDSVKLADSGRLTGTLTVLGSAIGAADTRGLRWTVSAIGNAAIESRKFPQAPKPHKDSSITNLNSLRKTIVDHLRATYPRLAGQIEIAHVSRSSSGVLLKLGLVLADWPAVRLGPIVARSDEKITGVVDRLLSKQSVARAANRQWSASPQHPRYGKLTSRLATWSPFAAEAKIECRLKLAHGLTPSWTEDIKCERGEWSTLEIQELTKYLEDFATMSDQLANQTLAKSTGNRVRLSLDRNAFGPGRWLRLYPFTLAFDARFCLPKTPLSGKVGRVLVDADGMHWPEKYTLTYMGTFNIPPWCALSEPEVTVDLKRRGLSIGCKLTPPIPTNLVAHLKMARDKGHPAGCLVRDRSIPRNQNQIEGVKPKNIDLKRESDRVRRTDGGFPTQFQSGNPWLEFLYVHGELSGNLKNRELFANADLWLLNRYRAAQASLSCNFQTRSARASLESRRTPARGLPDFRGDLQFDANGELNIDVQTTVAGCILEGQLTCVWRTQREIRIKGRATIPIIGRVAIEGVTDPRFENPEIHGDATYSQFGVNFDVKFWASRRAYWLTFSRRTPGGDIVTKRFEGPSVKNLDTGEVTNELKQWIDATNREKGKRKSPTEKEGPSIGRLKPAGDFRSAPDSDITPPPKEPKIYSESGLESEWHQNTGDLFVGTKPKLNRETCILRVPRAVSGIDSEATEKGCYLALWRRSNSSDEECWLLLVNASRRRIQLLHGRNRQLVPNKDEQPLDLTKVFSKVAPHFPVGATAAVKRAQRTMRAWCSLRLRSRDPQPPRVAGSAFRIDYAANGRRRKRTGTLFCSDGDFAIKLVDPVIPRNVWGNGLFRFLSRTKRDKPIAGYLIDYQIQTAARTLLVPDASNRTRARHRYLLTTRSDQGEWNLRVEVPSGDVEPLLQSLKGLARHWGRRDSASQKGRRTAFVGPAGVCVVDGREGFWLLPRHRASRKSPGRMTFLPRKRLNAWPGHTGRFLPGVLATPRRRENRQPKQLAELAVGKWDRKEWGVSPMALLVGLAESEPGSK